MAAISISGSAVLSLDGKSFIESSTFEVDVTDITEQTRDVTDTYYDIGVTGYSFLFVANIGTDDVIVRFTMSASYYAFFGVPPGGHVLLPGGGAGGSSLGFTVPAIRSVTSAGSRVIIMMGTQGDN